MDASTGTAEGGMTMPIDEYMKAACWIVCPMCDEHKCVGRFNCPEIKAWIEKNRGLTNDPTALEMIVC